MSVSLFFDAQINTMAPNVRDERETTPRSHQVTIPQDYSDIYGTGWEGEKIPNGRCGSSVLKKLRSPTSKKRLRLASSSFRRRKKAKAEKNSTYALKSYENDDGPSVLEKNEAQWRKLGCAAKNPGPPREITVSPADLNPIHPPHKSASTTSMAPLPPPIARGEQTQNGSMVFHPGRKKSSSRPRKNKSKTKKEVTWTSSLPPVKEDESIISETPNLSSPSAWRQRHRPRPRPVLVETIAEQVPIDQESPPPKDPLSQLSKFTEEEKDRMLMNMRHVIVRQRAAIGDLAGKNASVSKELRASNTSLQQVKTVSFQKQMELESLAKEKESLKSKLESWEKEKYQEKGDEHHTTSYGEVIIPKNASKLGAVSTITDSTGGSSLSEDEEDYTMLEHKFRCMMRETGSEIESAQYSYGGFEGGGLYDYRCGL